MTDPVADFLTRIRNAINASHETVDIPSSKLKREMARILTEQGYVLSFEVAGNGDRPGETLTLDLKYAEDRRPAISGLKRVSRPGQRHYAPTDNIRKVQGGMGTSIVSTSAGVMTGHDARKAGVGGEVLAEIW